MEEEEEEGEGETKEGRSLRRSSYKTSPDQPEEETATKILIDTFKSHLLNLKATACRQRSV